jgi:hypothetical protein
MSGDVASELAACVPELAADWALNAGTQDLATVALGQLAGRLVAVSHSKPTADFAPLFAELEVRLSNGDAPTRDILITGFLESLQNVDAARADHWQAFLGPSTSAAWNALYDMWAGRMKPGEWSAFVRGSHVTFSDAD